MIDWIGLDQLATGNDDTISCWKLCVTLQMVCP
jgi:hypothetical protein